MTTSTLTSKGRITVPSAVRKSLHLEPGDRVEFVEIEPGRFELIAATRPASALKGMFGKLANSVSVSDMNAAIEKRKAALQGKLPQV